MSRRLAITKRIDLSSVADGWDDCYVIVSGATFGEAAELAGVDFKSLSAADAAATSLKIATDHFVSGKIRVLGDNNEPELVDMEADDIAGSPSVLELVSAGVLGVIVDPKASSTPTETSPTSEPSTAQ